MEGELTNTLLFRFLTALAIGLLVGIERGWRERDAPAGSRTAGVRTYTLAAFLLRGCRRGDTLRAPRRLPASTGR